MRLARYCWLPLFFLASACQQKPSAPPSPEVKIGKPYVIEGTTYYPAYDPTYDKIGDASWYGPGFHGKYTASGEVYDQNDLTAAHPTLPMPSLVRVTNLENGRSLIVRINDRGPFRSSRIIDLSQKSAQRLGITRTTQVRVQYLKAETDSYIASLQSAASKSVAMNQVNDHVEDQKNAAIVQSTEPTTESPAELGAPVADSEIVEATTVTSHAGDSVSGNAPVLAVSSDDLPSAAPSKLPIEPVTQQMPVKQAWTAQPASTPVAAPADKEAIPPPVMAVTDNTNDAQPKVITLDHGDHYLHIETQPGEAVVLHTERITSNAALPDAAAHSLPSASGKFYIQAGSFAAEENAHKLADKLAPIGNVATGKVDMGEKTWWRVRLGPFKEKAEADEALDNVRKAGVSDARITHQ